MLLALTNMIRKKWWMVKSSIFKYVQQNVKYITIYIYIYICIYTYKLKVGMYLKSNHDCVVLHSNSLLTLSLDPTKSELSVTQ